MAPDQSVRVLSASEVEALIANPPSSLPAAGNILEFKYGSLIGFLLDPELVEDIGEVGAVNTTLERMFGHRINGLKILERGEAISAIVPLHNRQNKNQEFSQF